MTVTANTTRNDYTAGSAQSEYDYTFQLNEAADVDVYLDGVKQTLNTHYVVQNVGNASGGTIVFTLEDENGDPIDPTQGAIINIVMAMDLDRDTNYQPSGAFLAADVNNDFDRLWLATNQQQTAVNRALRLKDTDVTTSSMELPLKDDRKGKLLAFNATTGDPEATTNNQSNWDTAYNNSITSASFSGSTLTLGQQDGGTITASHTPYLPIAGGTLTGDLRFNDNDELKFGDSNDLRIYHTGTSSIIQDTGTGDLALLGTNLAFANGAGTAYYAAGTEGGAFTLYYNGSEKLATTSGGISVTGTITATGYNDSNWNAAYNDKINSASFDTSNGVLTLTQQDGGTVTVDLDGRYSTDAGIELGDNQKATFGDDNDLEIYHDGTNSYVKDTGTGYLILGNSDAGTIIKNGSGQNLLVTTASEIRLGHEGNTKLATKSTGIDVTGTVTADGLTVDTDTLYVDATNDTVGIGTTSPQKLLEVSSNSSPTVRISNTRNDTNWDTDPVFGALEFYSNDASGSGASVRSKIQAEATSQFGNATDLVFYSGNGQGVATEGMRLHYTGRLGIGTDEPNNRLHIKHTDNELARFESEDATAFISIKDNTATSRIQNNTGILSLEADLGAEGANSRIDFKVDNSEKMRIDSAGNLLVGKTSNTATDLGCQIENDGQIKTTSNGQSALTLNRKTSDGPIAILQKDGTTVGSIGTASSGITFASGGSTERMRITSAGRVGIGTNSPDRLLHILGDDAPASLQLERSTTELGAGAPIGIIEFKSNDASTGSSGVVGKIDVRAEDSTPDSRMAFYTHDNDSGTGTLTEQMRITSNGYVGIKKEGTNPTTELDVNGTVTATDFAGDGSALTGVLSDLIDDTTPQLGGNLDANDKEIQNVNQIGIGFSGNVDYNIHVEDSKASTNIEMMRIKNTGSYNGRVMTFYKGSNHHGSIGTSTIQYGQGVFVSSQQGGLKFQNQFSTVVVEPCGSDGADKDNSVDLGRSNNRFDDIYATNGTIQTSDRNLKQDIESLTDAEQRVAVAAKGLLRKFRWVDAVEEKGDDARIHFGIIAQDLRDAFTAEGLDAGRYAMFTSTTWWEHEGENYYEADHAPEGATEHTRLGVRYSELLAFIISAI